MATALNPQLIMGAVGNEVPLNDLASVYNNAAIYHARQAEFADRDEKVRHAKAVQQAYANSVGPDGQIDQAKLQASLAQGMAGDTIPNVLKSQSELDKQRAETGKTRADTGKTKQEALFNSLKTVDNSLSALKSNPGITDRDVYGEMGRLVNAGAFNMQAAEKGVSPDEYARDLLSTMPVGNPQALQGWLTQASARVADATERLKLQLPKYDEQDRGGVINEGTINQMTGQRMPGTNVAKTATPGELLTDARGKEYNAITKEAGASQVVETPQGFAVVNKGTANARPVAMENGQPVLGKDSQVAKNAQMADRLTGMIPMAKELLRNATASGAGALADRAMNFAGFSTKGADAATALETLSGWMTSNVPRFEGPQSDKDTATYQTMAGLVGDRTKPISTRTAALDTMQQIMGKYMGQRVSPYEGPPGTAPATPVAPRPLLPSAYAGPDRRRPSPVAAPAPAQGGSRPSLDSFFVGGQ